jgi:hypothetical protein
LSLAVAYLRLKQYDKHLQVSNAEAERLGGSPTRVLEIRGSIQALSGDIAGAEATAETLKSGKISGRMSPYSVALIYTAWDERVRLWIGWIRPFQEKDTWTCGPKFWWSGTV